jgi:hypothetical protein
MPRYSLIRQDRHAGDSGLMSEILDPESYKPIPGEVYPRVGYGIRVGSINGRSYSTQDYWQTTPITEITDEWIDEQGFSHVKFKTKNSTYIWKEF